MNTPCRSAFAMLAVAAAAIAALSCEENDVLAPTGTTIALTATPPEVVFDFEDPAPVEVVLTAQLLAESGFPQTGVAVSFATTSGTLASAGATLVTDSQSTVRDVLTVDVDAPDSIVVTARSGSISQALTLTTEMGTENCTNLAPVADAGGDQQQNATVSGMAVEVVLDGSNTTDDLPIEVDAAHYSWSCGNGTLPEPVVTDDYRRVICRYTPVTGLTNLWTATLKVFDNGETGFLVNGVYPCQESSTDEATVKLNLP